MSGVHTEEALEAAIEAHLLEHGWVSPNRSNYSVKLGLDPVELVTFLQASQPDEWKQLTERLGGIEAARDRVPAQVARQLDSRGTVDVLRGGIKMNGVHLQLAFFAPANGLVPELWDRYAANRLGVIRQLHHSESKPADSLDLVLTVNGIPAATAELKNPLTGQTALHAMRQYRRDRTPSDLIFRARAVVHFAVDPHEVHMATQLAGEATRFLPFNQGSGGPGHKGGKGNPPNPDGYQTAYLWEQVWQRDAWLDLLGTFVHVEEIHDADGKRTGKRRTVFPRYHQWHAVRSLLAATVEAGPGKNRLVQHSAGSGKSNTIAWTAHHLSRLHTPHNPAALSDGVKKAGLAADQPIFAKVVIITDRRVLDRQLQETVAGFEHTPGTIVTIDKDSAQLRDALAGNAARIIVTTLQKFPVVVKYAADAAAAGEQSARVVGSRFAVIIDEAHSSTSGEAMKDLKAALGGEDVINPGADGETSAGSVINSPDEEAEPPDAMDLVEASMRARGASDRLSLFAFTATPKPRTLELFGEPAVAEDGKAVAVPFHLYSMRQAIEEGFILDVLEHYTTYATYYRLANADGDPERTVPKGKAAAALARFVSLHATNLAQRAEIIVEHFRTRVAHLINGRAKAMVVTRSRLHAVRYVQAIRAYIAEKGYDTGPDAIAALVAFSGEVTDPDAPSVKYREAMMNGGLAESKLPAAFASDEYQVLVVAEKYQTGFDQPLLHTMYVDKKLAGVKAVQTLSRLNRTCPGKVGTFVLDFANTAEEIQEAFRPFYETTIAEHTDPNVLYDYEARIRAARVVDPVQQEKAVIALLSGRKVNQAEVYANLAPAVQRYVALQEADEAAGAEGADGQAEQFRDALSGFLRAYSFLAQVMPWTDRDLESLYLYGKALLELLPSRAGEPVPDLADAVALTHLRIEAVERDADLSLAEGTDEPGVALPGGGQGRKHDEPTDSLAKLIDALNERFGMNLGEADQVWVAQGEAAIHDDEKLKIVALNNDEDGYRIVLDKFLEDLLLDRHEANGELFGAFFANPTLRRMLLDHYVRTTYRHFRDEAG